MTRRDSPLMAIALATAASLGGCNRRYSGGRKTREGHNGHRGSPSKIGKLKGYKCRKGRGGRRVK